MMESLLKITSMTKSNKFLKEHLNVAWLRPESAFVDAVASTLISRHKIRYPSLDLGCGNGIFSFLTAGGEFSLDYDWYINVNTKGFWKNKDIYDVCKVKDLKQFIIKKPQYIFAAGFDHKSNLLKQAQCLSFYDSLVKCDANERLPFEDGQLKTVFSNMLHWLKSLKVILKEMHRVLDDNGIAILCLPNTKFFDYCFTYQCKKKNSELLRLLNRGRSECLHSAISYNDFSNLAKTIGFDIIDHCYYMSRLTATIWDIGLRPLSPVLIRMANSLTSDNRKSIKKEWIETLAPFFLRLYEMEIRSEEEGAFHLFVLRK